MREVGPHGEVWPEGEGPSEWPVPKLMAEIDRLRYWIDKAFAHASDGDAHGARKCLTAARWDRAQDDPWPLV